MHQDRSPQCGCGRKMGTPELGQLGQPAPEVAGRGRNREGAATEHGLEHDLQPGEARRLVEQSPDGGTRGAAARSDGANERIEPVAHHLWSPSCSGGREDPLGRLRCGCRVIHRGGDRAQWLRPRQIVAVADQSVRVCLGSQRCDGLGIEVGRQQEQRSDTTVERNEELDQGRGRTHADADPLGRQDVLGGCDLKSFGVEDSVRPPDERSFSVPLAKAIRQRRHETGACSS
jgi:hypothetical protein